jgi:hypothetical protein
VLVTNGYNEFLLEKASIDFINLVNAKFNIPAYPLKFLFVGNHTINKGLDILLEAMHGISIPIVLIEIKSAQQIPLCLRATMGARVGEFCRPARLGQSVSGSGNSSRLAS